MMKDSSDRWAVLIGINGYHESLGRLKYSVNDCRRLAEVLTTGDDAFPADHVLVLADDEADERKPTYANIHSWLASWLAQPDEDDTILVFFAGHGRYEDGKCYLVPGDATLQTIHVTGIPVSYVQELLNRCKARQKVLILDACHSGAGRDVSTMAAPMMETLSAGKGIYTLTSCDVDEVSHEWDEKAQGVFSYYLAEALSGSCPPDAHGRITAEAVYEWVFDRVRHWASRSRCSQNPKRVCDVSGAIVLRRAEPDGHRLALDLQKQLESAQREIVGLKGGFADAHQSRDGDLTRGRPLDKSRMSADTPTAEVPEWLPWLWLRALGVPVVWFVCGFIGLFGGLFGVLILTVGPPWHSEPGPSPYIGVPILVATILALLLISGMWYTISKNRYRQVCTFACLSAGDWVSGADYGLAIGRIGVDKSTVGSLLVKLAQLASRNDDASTSDALYRRAARTWNSPHAKRVLNAIGKRG